MIRSAHVCHTLIWDTDKEAENLRKHGVAFTRAQYAFADPQRVIAKDVAHSQPKIGFTASVRLMAASLPFASRTEERPSESSAQDIGAKENQFMTTRIKYVDEPFGDVEVVPDFLPSPAELAYREEGVKITLALSKKSIDFFKAEATKHQTQYQRMIRKLLDAYVDAQGLARPSSGRLRRR